MNTFNKIGGICLLALGSISAQKLVIGPPEKLYDNASIPGDPLHGGDFSMDGVLPSLRGEGEEISVFSSGFAGTTRYKGTLKEPLKSVEYFRERHDLYPMDADLATGKVHPWILGIHKTGDGGLIGFLHLEDQNTCPDDNFYCGKQLYRIGIAYSNDDGFTWNYCGDIIKPQSTGEWKNVGGAPYLVVGEYFYVYFNEHPSDGSPQRVSVARAKKHDVIVAAQAGNPTTWIKYNASLGGWTETNTGLAGLGSMILPSFPTYPYPANIYDTHSDAVYCRPLKQYFLLINVIGKGSFMYASKDGVAWENPVLIDNTPSIPAFPGQSVHHAYKTFMALTDATDDGREVGRNFYILYNIKPNTGTLPDYLYDDIYRRKVTVSQDITPSLFRLLR